MNRHRLSPVESVKSMETFTSCIFHERKPFNAYVERGCGSWYHIYLCLQEPLRKYMVCKCEDIFESTVVYVLVRVLSIILSEVW